MTNQAAYILRENTGTSGLVESARTAVTLLAEHGIPHLIVGGLAVQEHGYPRVTIDVDIVVPDVLEAVEFLTASLTGPFYRVPEFQSVSENVAAGIFACRRGWLPAARINPSTAVNAPTNQGFWSLRRRFRRAGSPALRQPGWPTLHFQTGSQDRVEDRRNGVLIDLLPAGKVLKRGCKVPFLQPEKVTEQFQIIPLGGLISLKPTVGTAARTAGSRTRPT